MAAPVPTRARAQLRQLFDAAIDATHGTRLLTRNAGLTGNTWHYQSPTRAFEFPLPAPGEGGKVVVLGAGKAAASLALGLELTLGTRIDRGGVCVKYAHGERLRNIQTLRRATPSRTWRVCGARENTRSVAWPFGARCSLRAADRWGVRAARCAGRWGEHGGEGGCHPTADTVRRADS